MARMKAAAALVAVAMSGAASAADPFGYEAFRRGDMVAAEAALDRQVAASSINPAVKLNLAAAYARTGRPAEARALYGQVLARGNARMAGGEGAPVWAHRVAERGLARLGTVEVAGR